MKVLFVGFFYNPEKEDKYLEHSKVGFSVASNLYQWNVIKGIHLNEIEIEAIGSIPYGNYPKLSDIVFCYDETYIHENIRVKQIGFINYYVLKHRIRVWKLKKYISQWVKKNQNENCVVIFYDFQTPFLSILKWIKCYKNVKTCTIITDLFGAFGSDRGIAGIKRYILDYIAKREIFWSDSYIFLTEQMNEVVNQLHRPYIIVDGIVDEEKNCEISIPKKRVIMYAGNLSKQYNILNLLYSFEKTKYDNLELWFCGKGNTEHEIIEATKRDNRIRYLGFVSKSELNRIERDVCFYINPRINNGLYTKYSFSSKNLEYLLAGKPVIAYKLDGISNDYDDIFLYLSEKDNNSLDKMFEKVSTMTEDEIRLLATQGMNFVKQHNGKKYQAKRIVMFLEGIFNGNK